MGASAGADPHAATAQTRSSELDALAGDLGIASSLQGPVSIGSTTDTGAVGAGFVDDTSLGLTSIGLGTAWVEVAGGFCGTRVGTLCFSDVAWVLDDGISWSLVTSLEVNVDDS